MTTIRVRANQGSRAQRLDQFADDVVGIAGGVEDPLGRARLAGNVERRLGRAEGVWLLTETMVARNGRLAAEPADPAAARGRCRGRPSASGKRHSRSYMRRSQGVLLSQSVSPPLNISVR